MGMRQSFIRKPGTEQILVRIGIGRDGVFKVDGMENKVRQMGDPFVDGATRFHQCFLCTTECKLLFSSHTNHRYGWLFVDCVTRFSHAHHFAPTTFSVIMMHT